MINLILIFFVFFEFICILYVRKISIYLNKYQLNKQENKYFKRNDYIAKFLVVIPAHNEGLQIRDSIKSIKKVDYPQNLIDVVLLNDRCTDNTVQIAYEEKIKIYNLKNKKHTKGGVLKYFCLQYKNIINNYDYLCIIDADTLVDSNFFIAANEEFIKGHKIVQGQVNSIKCNGSVSCFMSLFQLIINNFMNYQSKLKKSIILSGKGLLISPQVLKQIEWDENILIEDVDFSFNALLKGYSIYYCSKMKVNTKHPYTFLDMWIQQRRWTSGQRQTINKYNYCIINDKLTGTARAFILIGYLNFILFCLIIISLLNLKIYFSIILSLYICCIIAIIIFLKSMDIKDYTFKNILNFPIILFYWHFISFISFFCPEKQWKQIKNK